MGFVAPGRIPGRVPALLRGAKISRCMRRGRARRYAQTPLSCAEMPESAAAWVGDMAATTELTASDKVVATAHAAADAAGVVIRRYFRQRVESQVKGDASPVTQADTEAEAAIRDVILSAFPTHRVLGEEGGGATADALARADWAWVIDPIDGTKAFMAGRPTFGTLIAVLRRGVPVFGLIDQPVAAERWAGGFGRRATFNGEPANVRDTGPLRECVVHATTPDMFVGLDGVAFRAVAGKARHVVYGSDCYAYALLASGHVDVVVEADLKPWDFLALAPVVEAAGGVMTDWYGERIGPDSDGRVVAGASHKIVAEVLDELDKGLKPVTDFQDRGPGHVQAIAGYGEAVETDGAHCISVRMRAEHHDVCDVVLRGPDVLAPYEAELSSLVEQEMLRGRIITSIEVAELQSAKKNVNMLPETRAALNARRVLDDIAAAAGVDSTPTLADVLSAMDRMSLKMETPSLGAQPAALLPLARRAVVSASAALISSRRRTGAALERDALERISKINSVLEELKKRLAPAVEDQTSSLNHKEIVEPAWGALVEQACAHTHMLAVGFMGVDGGVGMRISLLAREVVRSARAIAECANDAIIAHHAVLIEEEGLGLGGIGRRIR